MGFFSFLGRKTAGDKAAQTTLKGQAYDSTVAALPPVLGTYPVAGNGPNVLDQLQRAARKRSEAQLSTLQADNTAPAPSIPRFRDRSDSRPNTAPAPTVKAERPKSAGRNPHRLSRAWPFLSDTGHSSFTAGSVHSAESQPPPVPSIAAYHTRDGSAESPHGSAFVDILDARGDIRPYDFRSRVRAAGAREYGEDVAQRNLGENALDLRSPEAQAFYRVSGGAALAFRPDGSAVDVHGNTYYTDAPGEELDESAPPPVIARGELSKEERANRARGLGVQAPAAAPRSTSFNMATLKSLSRADKTFEKDETWIRSAERRPETHHGARSSGFLEAPGPGPSRRSSLNAFASSPQKDRSKPRPLSLHRSQSNFSMGPSSPPPLPRYRPKSSVGPGQRPRSSISTTESRDSGLKHRPRNDSRPHTQNDKKARSDFSEFSSPVSHSSRGSRYPSKRGSMASSSGRNSSSGAIPQGIGRVEVESPADGASDDPAPSPHIPSYKRHPEPQILSKPDNFQEWTPIYGSARGEHSHPLTRPSSSSSLDPSRRRSVGGATLPAGRPRLGDITEHIPIRTSSLAIGGPACVTPTTPSSRHSSNPFLRPQSQHTADTSVDLPIPVPQLKPGPEMLPRQRSDSVTSGGNNDSSAYFTAAEDDISVDTNASHAPGGYRSQPSRRSSFGPRAVQDVGLGRFAPLDNDGSDTDSFVYDQQRTTVSEEGLLFNEGIYGDAGRGLPGLFDMFSGQNSPPVPETPTSFDRPFTNSNHSTPGKRRRGPHLRHSHSTPVYSQRGELLLDDDDESTSDDSDSFSGFDYQLPRGRPVMKFQDLERDITHARRDTYGFIGEEDGDEGSINGGSATKTRKDHGRRGGGDDGQTSRGAVSERSRYDEGNSADMEY